jgi:hypothetical protein
MLHGIARTVLVVPRIGKEAALKASIFTGSALALGICFLFVPGIGLQGLGPHLGLGVLLSAFMASFDMAVGKFVMRKSWPKIMADFNPGTGNYLLYGLFAMVSFPALVHALRG